MLDQPDTDAKRQHLVEVVRECWDRVMLRAQFSAKEDLASLDDAIRGGEALHEARHYTDLKHGQWMKWVAANIPFSHRKVVDWMIIWTYRKEIGDVANIGEALRTIRRLKLHAAYDDLRKNPRPLPEGQYGLIVADPPWPLDDLPYPVMSIKEIRALPVATVAADDCVLFLWRVCRFDREAHDVMRDWGFEYAGRKLTWVKDRANHQHPWLAGRHEDCIIGTRGNPPIRPGQVDVIEAARGRHSEKPQEAFDRIEAMCPAGNGQRLELFARRQRRGWTVYGNEA
jgi:N6-adenosine-specific RNA methylase IME4